MPEPGSNRGYRAWQYQYIEPILLMLIGGGRHIEELREIINDVHLPFSCKEKALFMIKEKYSTSWKP